MNCLTQVSAAALTGLVSIALTTGVCAQAATQTAVEAPAFYADTRAELVRPGQWLASEPLPADMGLPSAARQIRFVYSATNGVTGEGLLRVSGAVFLPEGPAPEGGRPVVAWAHGTVGVNDACAPSLAGRSARDVEYLGYWLAAGYAVVSTDYQGLGTPGAHPYLHNRAAAYSVLDAVRAARAELPELGDKILIVGQSQGAAAAISTAAFAPAYAPELQVLGTVATGVPNVIASLSRANQGDQVARGFDPAVAYMMYLAASTDEADPSRSGATAFQPRALPVYAQASELCTMPMLQAVRAAGLTQANAVSPAFLPLYAAEVAAIRYPSLKLEQPLFIGAGVDDIDTPASGQLDIARQACLVGTVVEAHLYSGRDHASTVNGSVAHSRVFAAKLLAGEPVDARCEPEAE